MKTKQQFLTFLFVFTISTTIISLCVLEKFSALFHAFGPRSDSFCNFFGHRANKTFFIIVSSYDRQMCLLHTESHLQIVMTNDQVSCHHSSHYHHCVDAPDDVLLTLTIFSSRMVFQKMECGSSSDTAIILLPIFCLYRQPMPIFCLCVGSAYIFRGDSQIFQLLPSLAYSVSRDRFILVNLHHMSCYL